MAGAMPEHTTDGLDVTKAEQRYLRRTFRRMALPWLAVLMAFTWWMASGPSTAPDPSEELAALRAGLAELNGSVAALREGLEGAERRNAELAARLAESATPDTPAEVETLRSELKRAARRIAALEGKLGPDLGQRFDALADRIASVEGLVRLEPVPAAPTPLAPPD